jgi:hypothetical protein
MGGVYGQKDFVFSNAEFFPGNGRFLGASGPGSPTANAAKTSQHGEE